MCPKWNTRWPRIHVRDLGQVETSVCRSHVAYQIFWTRDIQCTPLILKLLLLLCAIHETCPEICPELSKTSPVHATYTTHERCQRSHIWCIHLMLHVADFGAYISGVYCSVKMSEMSEQPFLGYAGPATYCRLEAYISSVYNHVRESISGVSSTCYMSEISEPTSPVCTAQLSCQRCQCSHLQGVLQHIGDAGDISSVNSPNMSYMSEKSFLVCATHETCPRCLLCYIRCRDIIYISELIVCFLHVM